MLEIELQHTERGLEEMKKEMTLVRAMKKAKASVEIEGPYRPDLEVMRAEIIKLRRDLRAVKYSKPGRPPSLTTVQSAMLLTKVKYGTPIQAGFTYYPEWTGNVVQRYVEKEFRVVWTIRTAQRYLKELK